MAEQSEAKPRITYFDMRGRVEMIRITLEELGVEYEDRRILTPQEWAELRPRTPFGQLPIYEEGNLLLVHSHAIIRHIARTRDLYGQNLKEHARCDVIEESFYDAQETLWRFFWRPHFETKKSDFTKSELSPTLAGLEKLLDSVNTEYLVASGLTYVDLYAFVYLDQLRALFADTLAEFPRLSAFRKRIASRPRISDYLSSGRRPTAFGMGIHGLIQDPEASGPKSQTPWD